MALAALCISLTRDAGNIAALWLANALAIGVMLKTDTRTWPFWIAAAIVGSIAGNLVMGDGFGLSVAFSVANLTEIIAAAGIMRGLIGRELDHHRFDHLGQFVIIVCVAAPAIGATVGAEVVHEAFGAPYWAVWKVWIVGDLMGIVLLVPAVFCSSLRQIRTLSAADVIEGAVVALSAAIFVAVILAQTKTAALYMIFPAIVWAAVRFGIFGNSALATLMAIAMIWGTLQGWGPIAELQNLSTADRILHLQGLFGTTVVAGYLIAVFLGQREQAETTLKLVTDSAPALISYVDRDRRYQFVNPKYKEWWRRDTADIIGKRVEEFLPAEVLEATRERIDKVLAGESILFPLEIPNPDGTLRPLDVRYEPDVDANGEVQGFVVLAIDQSDRQAAEKAARETAARLQLVTDTTPALISYIGKDGTYQFVNAAYEAWWGLPREQLIGRRPSEFLSEEVLAETRPYAKRTLAGEMVTFQIDLPLADGTTPHVEVRYAPDFGPDGEVRGFVVLINDVTERRDYEALLRRNELILNAAGDGIYGVDLEGKATFVNPEAAKLLGYKPEELIGQLQHKLLHHTHADGTPYPLVDCPIYAAFKDGKVHDISGEVFWRKDGSSFPVEYSSTPLRDEDNELVGAVVVFRDVTDRLASETAKRRAESFLDGAISSMPEGFVLFGSNGKLLMCNERYRDFFSDIKDILVPGTALEVILEEIASRGLVVQARGREVEYVATRLKTLGEGFALDGFVTKERALADGRWIIIDESKLADGSVVMVLNDITELKAREAELQRSNEELQKFAYVASHDLQEPLRKVQAFGDRLSSRFSQDLPEEGQLYVERMQASAKRMQVLIRDLLDFSRVATKEEPFEKVDLEAVAYDAIGDLEVAIAESGAMVSVTDMPPVWGDAGQLRQIFQNLLSNAIKFRKLDHCPTILISGKTTADPAARVPSAEIRVTDDGIGFDEQYTDRIFEVFQRLHGRDAYEGTGVGLAICRKITERHGGTLVARSEPGKGATFIVTLPLATAAPDNSETEPSGDP